MVKERDITGFFHSHYAVAMLVAVVCVITVVNFHGMPEHVISGNNGIALPSADCWIANGYLSMCLNLAANIAIVLMMVYLNRTFNVLRSITKVYAGMFIVMQFAVSELLSQFYSGTLLCLVVMLCTIILFSCYNDSSNLQRILLIFILLAAGVLTQYAFLPYMLLFLLGCWQMRILDLKALLAAGMGILTPLWILYGLGIISLGDFKLPEFHTILAASDSADRFQLLLTYGITAFVCVALCVINMVNAIGYNARTRALNGFLFLMSWITLIMSWVDFYNLITYIPLLNCCTAFQLGHIFLFGSEAQRGYLGIVLVIVVYAGLYTLDLWL